MHPNARRMGLAALLAPLLLAGCESYRADVAEVPSSLPTAPARPYAALNACIGARVDAWARSRHRRIALLVDGLGDRTLRPHSPASGDLTNAGGVILRGIVRRTTAADAVYMPLSTPIELRAFFEGAPVGILAYRRLQAEAALGPQDTVIAVTGGFTVFDRTRATDGTGAASRYDSHDVSAAADMGRASESARVELTLQIGTIAPNQLLATIELTAVARRTSAIYKLEGRVNGFGIGLQQRDVVADGIQAVQANMLEAATYLMWDRLLPADWPRTCPGGRQPDPGWITDRARDYLATSRQEKIRRLQVLLNRFLGPAAAPLPEDGVLDAQTWRIVRRAEQAFDLPPASEGDIDNLYLQLLRRFDGTGPGDGPAPPPLAAAPAPAPAPQVARTAPPPPPQQRRPAAAHAARPHARPAAPPHAASPAPAIATPTGAAPQPGASLAWWQNPVGAFAAWLSQ